MHCTKIIVVSFKYPPYPRVGGFRWAKLAKQLAKMGHTIDVVTVDWQQDDKGLSQSVAHPNIRIHKIPSRYPINAKLWEPRNKWIRRIKNRVFMYGIDALFWDDEAMFWRTPLFKKLDELVQEQNITIVATGHPFRVNYLASEYKRHNPCIRLIQDFQDPWLHELTRKTDSQKEEIKKLIHASIENADHVLAVTQGLLERYKSYNTNSTAQFSVLANGFDADTLSQIQYKSAETFWSFCHIGSIFNKRQEPLIQFLQVLQEQLNNLVSAKVTLVGRVDESIPKMFPALVERGVLELLPPVSQAEAFAILARHTFALQLNADVFPYLVSTKIYEHGAIGIPTVSINYGGEIDTLVSSHKLGFSFHAEDPETIRAFLQASPNTIQHQIQGLTYNVQEFDYTELAKQFVHNVLQD